MATLSSGKVVCYPCDAYACFDPRFVTSELQTPALQEATEQINAVLDRVGAEEPDLAILAVGGRLMLFDVEEADVDVDPDDVNVSWRDDPERIWEVLAVRPE